MASIEELGDDIVLLILKHLDGPSLAAIGSCSSYLRHLSSLPSLWLSLCLSNYPSLLLHPFLSSSPRCFFSLAFPFPSPSPPPPPPHYSEPPPDFVFSFVDLRIHGEPPILSRVLSTDTRSVWFPASPFRVEAFHGSLALDPGFSAADIELSWVMADRSGQRAVNLSSRKAVAVETNWFSGAERARFAMLSGDGQNAVIASVICGQDGVREVGLTVEDADGIQMNGQDSMVILGEMMDADRRGKANGRAAEEARIGFAEYLRRRREKRGGGMRREGRAGIRWISSALSVLSDLFEFPVSSF